MKISEIIVVEGKNDIEAIKRAVDADCIATSGSGLSKEKIEFLKELSKQRKIIVLMDPDGPGEKIRAIISEHIPDAKHAFIKKSDAIYKGDVGIENASVEVIRESLRNLLTPISIDGKLTVDDLIDYKLVFFDNSSQLRAALGSELKIGFCNGKTLLKRLNMLQITKNDLGSIMEGLNGK